MSLRNNTKRQMSASESAVEQQRANSRSATDSIAQESRSLLNEPIPERLQKLVDKMRLAERNKQGHGRHQSD